LTRQLCPSGNLPAARARRRDAGITPPRHQVTLGSPLRPPRLLGSPCARAITASAACGWTRRVAVAGRAFPAAPLWKLCRCGARACSDVVGVRRFACPGNPLLRIDYPGLPDHSGHQVSRRLFTPGLGRALRAIVTVTPHAGASGMASADKLQALPSSPRPPGRDDTVVSQSPPPRNRQLNDRVAGGRGPSTRGRYASLAWRTPRPISALRMCPGVAQQALAWWFAFGTSGSGFGFGT